MVHVCLVRFNRLGRWLKARLGGMGYSPVWSEEASSFLDLDSGELTTVSHELLGEAEEEEGGEEPDLPEWQKAEWAMARRMVSTDRFVPLPTKFDVHEWAIMQEFAHSVTSEAIREDLLYAIHGEGAFRHFKHVLRQHRIESAWFQFREKALRQIAIDWCEEHHIAWE